MGNQIIKEINIKKSIEEKEEVLFDFINEINEVQCDSLIDYYNSLSKKKRDEFFDEINEKGIFIHQPPFYGNITLDKMIHLYQTYNELFKPLKFINIENPLILGELYFMKLKHEPKGKFSARSSSYMSMKNIPAKSTKFKEHQQLYPKTPIKWGEMEFTNSLIGNNMEIVKDFKEAYSTNEDYRLNSFLYQLTKNPFNLECIPNPNTDSRTKMILDTSFTTLGFKLVETEEEIEEEDENKEE